MYPQNIKTLGQQIQSPQLLKIIQRKLCFFYHFNLHGILIILTTFFHSYTYVAKFFHIIHMQPKTQKTENTFQNLAQKSSSPSQPFKESQQPSKRTTTNTTKSLTIHGQIKSTNTSLLLHRCHQYRLFMDNRVFIIFHKFLNRFTLIFAGFHQISILNT